MKNNMDYFKTMNEKDLDLTKTAVDWTDKAFRGNGDCAAIARTTGKTCKVVLRDGEDTSFLEGIHDSHLRGDTMNDIYAYDPDTEEEAGQCMDEVIQIAEESGAEIQFY